MAKKKCYIVKLTPRHKGSGYPTQTVKPYLKKICWNQKRAIKEAKFALKSKLTTGVHVKDAYKYKIMKGK